MPLLGFDEENISYTMEALPEVLELKHLHCAVTASAASPRGPPASRRQQ
jgi:hypothetical protein